MSGPSRFPPSPSGHSRSAAASPADPVRRWSGYDVLLGGSRLGGVAQNRRGARGNRHLVPGIAGGDGLATRVAIVGAVSHNGVDHPGGLIKQRADLGGVTVAGGRQPGGDDGVGGGIHREMELAPGPQAAHAVFVAAPLIVTMLRPIIMSATSLAELARWSQIEPDQVDAVEWKAFIASMVNMGQQPKC